MHLILIMVVQLSKCTYFAIFTTTYLSDDFILLLITPVHCQSFVIPIIPWSMNVNVRIDAVVQYEYYYYNYYHYEMKLSEEKDF